jgi:hypothetical protein
MSKIVSLRPSNNLWRELGNNTYTFDEALSELVDNSISASEGNTECNISIEFYLNKSNNPNYFLMEYLDKVYCVDLMAARVRSLEEIRNEKIEILTDEGKKGGDFEI